MTAAALWTMTPNAALRERGGASPLTGSCGSRELQYVAERGPRCYCVGYLPRT